MAQWTVEKSLVGRGNDLLNVLGTVTDSEGNYGFPPSMGGEAVAVFPIVTSGFLAMAETESP